MENGIRLIDANALKAKIEAAGEDGTIANYCRKVMADCLDSDAPTVEAIPVGWLQKHMNEPIMAKGIHAVLYMWRKEQEAKNNA